MSTVADVRRGVEGAGEPLLQESRRRAADPFADGFPQFNEAALLALLGRKDEAVRQLGVAFREGQPYTIGVHADPLFESLWDYPPFRTLVKPRR
jgi:hypothetical protein